MDHFVGRTLRDTSGTTIGTVSDVVFDDRTLTPQFLVVKSGRLFGREHMVPVEAVSPEADELRTTYSKDEIAHAPGMKSHALTARERDALYQHFHIQHRAA